jgi:hypothetical protein
MEDEEDGAEDKANDGLLLTGVFKPLISVYDASELGEYSVPCQRTFQKLNFLDSNDDICFETIDALRSYWRKVLNMASTIECPAVPRWSFIEGIIVGQTTMFVLVVISSVLSFP